MECKYRIKDEIEVNGKRYDGCMLSKGNLPKDVCHESSTFCKEARRKVDYNGK